MTTEYKKASTHCYCRFCKADGVKRVAEFMTKYAGPRGRDHSKHYACAQHINLMEDTDPDRTEGEKLKSIREYMKKGKDDTDMSEADYQTWGRL